MTFWEKRHWGQETLQISKASLGKRSGTDFYRTKSQETSVTLSSPLTSFLNKYVFIFWKSKPLNIPLWPGIVYFCFVFQLFLGVLETEEGRLLYRYCLIMWKMRKWLNIAKNIIFMNITVGVTAGESWTVPGLTGSGPAMQSQAQQNLRIHLLWPFLLTWSLWPSPKLHLLFPGVCTLPLLHAHSLVCQLQLRVLSNTFFLLRSDL